MIEIENLSKAFQVAKRKKGALRQLLSRETTTVHALSNVSFSIKAGEIVGYIGPNGAGKSTTIKIMSGILRPTSGKCTILGRVPWESRMAHVKDIGVVFGQRTQLWWDVPVIDSFELLKDIYHLENQTYLETLNELTSALNIVDLLDVPVRQLSLGQRMRCEIAAALLHRPKILFLDEPTIGLDAVSKIAVRHFIKHINQRYQVTVLLTTHDMSDIEALANRIILIGKGEKLYDGDLDSLKSNYITSKRLIIDHVPNQPPLHIHGCHTLSETSERTELSIDLSQTSVPKVIRALAEQRELIDFSVESPPIEELIVSLYKDYSL